MNRTLAISNRQRAVKLDTQLLRHLTESLLTGLLALKEFDLALCIVRAPEMARVNETFLQHKGSTDVITFDYTDDSSRRPEFLHGELFICIDDAKKQAREFGTTWQKELARYVIHGVLHLRGFDDLNPAARRKMKREENRLLQETGRLFPLSKLDAGRKLAA